jgi:hypothetical protein
VPIQIRYPIFAISLFENFAGFEYFFFLFVSIRIVVGKVFDIVVIHYELTELLFLAVGADELEDAESFLDGFNSF